MKHRVLYAMAITAVLLMGAGCAKRTTPQVTGLPAPQVPSTAKEEPSVDTPAGAAAAIIKDMDIEAGIYDDEDGDAEDAKAGTKEVVDFTDTVYDISQ